LLLYKGCLKRKGPVELAWGLRKQPLTTQGSEDSAMREAEKFYKEPYRQS
jgi:hypothetical protein